jgi:hypothetical protein
MDLIKKGDVIAVYDNEENIIALKDGYVLLPNVSAKINEEWFYIGCEKVDN